MSKAIDICYECGKEYESNQWISVKDRYPDKKGRYLVQLDTKYKTQKICKYFPCDRFIQSPFMPVTHWQPLPEPSKEHKT